MSINVCIFSGRLTRDAEIWQTQSGKTVGNYTLAVDDGWGENKKALFIRCVDWGAEHIAKWLIKGFPVIVEGRMQEREYTDQQGQQRRIMEINVRRIEFQQGGGKSEQQEQKPQQEQEWTPPEQGMSEVPF